MKVEFIKKHVWVISFAIGIIGTIIISLTKPESIFDIQQGIAKEVIRFHVLANSDEQEDQALKLKVKEDVVSYMQEEMGEQESVDEARSWMQNHLGELKQVAKKTINQNGYDYGVTANLEKAYFPIKTYGDCTLPNGIYEALQIKIGEAEGKNWWCVLYPSLCFTDSIYGVVTEDKKQELSKVLTEEEYDVVTNKKKVVVKSKIWENISQIFE